MRAEAFSFLGRGMDFKKYNIRNYSFFGLRVTSFDRHSLIQCLIDAVHEGKQLVCFGYSLTLFPRFRELPQIYHISETFEIMVADGKGFYHLCRVLGTPLDSDWALYELTDALLVEANKKQLSVLLLGSDEESNRQATCNLRLQYPSATIKKGFHGYFQKTEEHEIVEYINSQNPDILMIGISSPTKEEFVFRNRAKLNVPVIVPMGGVIDIYAGKTKPIPPVVKNLCLTWLYRFIQEPRRTRIIFRNGMDVLFRLIPVLLWNKWFKRNKVFSIPAFYGVGKKDLYCTKKQKSR